MITVEKVKSVEYLNESPVATICSHLESEKMEESEETDGGVKARLGLWVD